MARPVHVIPRRVFDARLVERAVDAGVTLAKHRVAEIEVDRRRRRPRRPLPRAGRDRRRRRAQRAARPPRAGRRQAGAGDPWLRPDPAGPGRHPGDPLRRPPPAVVRLGLRPRRRTLEHRVRRAAARAPHRRPAQPRRPARAARPPAARQRRDRRGLEGAPPAAVGMALGAARRPDPARRRCRAPDQPDDGRGHLLRGRYWDHRRPRDRPGLPGPAPGACRSAAPPGRATPCSAAT